MNRKDLKFELDKLGVNQSLYSLTTVHENSLTIL